MRLRLHHTALLVVAAALIAMMLTWRHDDDANLDLHDPEAVRPSTEDLPRRPPKVPRESNQTPNRIRVVVQDRLTEQPLTQVAIGVRESSTSALDVICRVGDDGAAITERASALRSAIDGSTLRLVVSEPSEVDSSLELLPSNVVQEDELITLFVDVYAIIDVVVAPRPEPDRRLRTHVQLLGCADPPAGLTARERNSLIASRHFADGYRDLLRVKGLSTDVAEFSADFLLEEARREIPIRFAGRLYVVASMADDHDYGQAATIIDVERGEVVPVRIEPRQKPIVTGVVIDEKGRAVAGVNVTVQAKSLFGPDEVVGRSGDYGYVVTRFADIERSLVSATARDVSDSSGRFSVSLPFTGDVAVWTFDPKARVAGKLSVDLVDRWESAENLTLELAPHPSKVVRIILPTGEPFANETVRITEPERMHFSVDYPLLSTDEEGWLDSWCLRPSTSYMLAPQSARYRPTQFRLAKGQVVVLTPK